ncbi:hypothetical protein EGW08_005344 [Elysia chlorotica]|uniref:Btz domain-containing protein n=1 Tax=Elysia chlorotica TaxID=188477 RepID=A0A433TZB8_ELYCH|nr:hypothetical protein EGW08_005344 [Elysia chlorotica]
MPQDRSHRRKRSRSFSPVPSKHKRSWQNDEPKRPSSGPRRSLSPPRGGKKPSNFKPSPGFSGKRDMAGSSPPRGPRRSPSPLLRKRPMSRSPVSGRHGPPSPGPRPMRDAPPPRRDSKPGAPIPRSGLSARRQRSISPRQGKKIGNDRMKHDGFYSKRTPSPEARYHSKKKSRLSSPGSPLPPANSLQHHHHHTSTSKTGSGKKRTGSSSFRRSLSPLAPAAPSGGGARGDPMLQQRKVTSASKKKFSRLTLNKRFTAEDQEHFRLEENVTIAILRNPNAEPSEEVTVKRVFDSSVFKMIHKKTEGRKPIFDREEIKVWRHDDNLADDPDFERRLVRVKSSSQAGKPASDSLSRMSPDVIRKAFGLQVGARSKSRSPHREPQIRLDPKPDPRYESKYRQQLEKEERRRPLEDGTRRGVIHRGGSLERNEDRRRPGGEEARRGQGEYDLRHALERRRSDREDGGGFRIEVRQDDLRSTGDHFYRGDPRGGREYGRRFSADGGGDGGGGGVGGRNVVFGNSGGGGGDRYESLSPERDGRWEDRGRPFRGRVRGRGRGRGIRGRRLDRSPEHRGGEDFRRERERSMERRPRYSNSPPPSSRGWRGNRGRGRGRGRDFNSPYRAEIVSPTEIDDSFKYTQHDDRDISPKAFRGRGGRGRGRFPTRSFGSNNFRGTNRGGYRGRGFRGKSFGSLGNRDRRTPDRSRDRSADREWKHDMYDSLQGEEEQPHSTTLST